MVVKDRKKGYRIAISLTDVEKENLYKVLEDRKQTANEFITLAVWDFVKGKKQVEITKRIKGIPRVHRINFFTSKFLYDWVEKKAKEYKRPMSEVVYNAVKPYLK